MFYANWMGQRLSVNKLLDDNKSETINISTNLQLLLDINGICLKWSVGKMSPILNPEDARFGSRKIDLIGFLQSQIWHLTDFLCHVFYHCSMCDFGPLVFSFSLVFLWYFVLFVLFSKLDGVEVCWTLISLNKRCGELCSLIISKMMFLLNVKKWRKNFVKNDTQRW